MADSEITKLSNTMPQVSKSILSVLNQLCELERKLGRQDDPANLSRNVSKMKDAFAEIGYEYENPMGQACNETRTDLDTTISGSGTENLVVVEVIKPIIRYVVRDGHGKFSTIIQKGVVVVEARKEN